MKQLLQTRQKTGNHQYSGKIRQRQKVKNIANATNPKQMLQPSNHAIYKHVFSNCYNNQKLKIAIATTTPNNQILKQEHESPHRPHAIIAIATIIVAFATTNKHSTEKPPLFFILQG